MRSLGLSEGFRGVPAGLVCDIVVVVNVSGLFVYGFEPLTLDKYAHRENEITLRRKQIDK